MQNYSYDLKKDLPVLMNRVIAQKMGRIGGITLKPVRNAMDKRVNYDLRDDFPVFDIKIAPWLGDHIFGDVLDNVEEDCIQCYVFIDEASDAIFVFNLDDGPHEDCDNDIGYLSIKKSHDPFFTGENTQIPAYLDNAPDDYLDEWEEQRMKQRWPAHMEKIATCFWDFLQEISTKLKSYTESEEPKPLTEAEQQRQAMVEKIFAKQRETELRIADDFYQWRCANRSFR